MFVKSAKIIIVRGPVIFRNMRMFYREGLSAPRPSRKFEGHHLSIFCDCLFNIYIHTHTHIYTYIHTHTHTHTAILHIWRSSPPSTTGGRAM